MFGGGFSSSKLKTNLRLCINRLKLVVKKKAELGLKTRKEIAEYLAQNKDDRARIKVEHIIREDYMIEAMECMELYCDLILARIGLIETQKYCDEGLATPVCTLIWIAPRLQQEIAEFKVIADQLSSKFGKDFAKQAINNTNGAVDPKVKNKITLKQPAPSLVEHYLIEIANAHNIPFEPNQGYLLGDDYFGGPPGGNNNSGGGGGGGDIPAGSIPPAPGFSGFGDILTGPPQMDPPPLPNSVNYTSDNTSHGVSSMPGSSSATVGGAALPPPPQLPQFPPQPPSAPRPQPSLPTSTSLPQPPSAGPAFNQLPSYKETFDLPHLPSVPSGSFPASTTSNEDVDFDDLNRRFEELKKKR